MITLNDIKAAAGTLNGRVVRTPVVESPVLSERLGTNIYLKLELLQRTGSFKPRGAFVQILNREAEAREKGVVAVSGGNFAIGVAFAARQLGVKATICMADYTPQNYIDATKAHGADVVLLPDIAAAFARADKLAEEGLVGLHPFDGDGQIAGSGTVGLEIMEDVPQMTDVFISIGGGGLIAGSAVAIKSQNSDVRVWGVETEKANAMQQALAAGEVVSITPTSLAKTLGAPFVSSDTLEIMQKYLEDLIVVSDEQAIAAQRILLEQTKLLTELAASCVLSAAEEIKGKFTSDSHVVFVICGGNESPVDMINRW